MNIIEAIAKREDVSPKEGKSKYGDVKFADEKNKKYPIDTEAHAKAALSYWGHEDNRAKYSSEDQKTIGGRIRAAAKRFGIEVSDDDGDKKAESSLRTQDVLVTSAYETPLNGQAPAEVMYMPAGRSVLKARVNGKPGQITVNVTKQTADILQASLTKLLTEPVGPFVDFNHKGEESAAAPSAFRWDDQGVMMSLDWSAAGKSAVEGKTYNFLSPTFLLNKNEEPSGLPDDGPIAALTNRPAFRRMQKIAASEDPNSDPDPDDDLTQGTNMKIADKLVELELITAEQAEDEAAISAALDHLSSVLTTTQASNAALVQENTALKAEAERVKGTEADAVIQAAIAEGKIPSQDKDVINFYRAQLIAKPDVAKKVLAAMPSNPVLKKVIDVKAGDSRGNLMAEGKTKARLVADQHNVVNEIMAANPKMSHADAFNKAKREHAELFIEAV